MLRKIFILIVFWCVSGKALGQQGRRELDAYVAAAGQAYDNNSDSLEYYVNKAVPLAI